jgi:hypothetical protein
LTPSARSANLIAGDGTENGFPAPNKELAQTKNDHLTGKAPGSNLLRSSEESCANPVLPAIAANLFEPEDIG